MMQLERQVIVLANREPYSHDRDCAGTVAMRRSSSGVVNAVEPLVIGSSGVWVGHGSGNADREFATERDGLRVPSGAPAYRLRRVWLSEEEEREYYDGCANGALWPLCHRAYVQPVFRSGDFATYSAVNARFADAVCEEATGAAPVILVQDYHFALAPRMLRRRLPSSRIGTFWHIPWPDWQTFSICPWRHDLVRGLLGSDVVGFQTPIDCRNFVETVDRVLGAQIDPARGVIEYEGGCTVVRDYPASIDWPGNWTKTAPIAACREAVRRDLRLDQRIRVGVGVDRLDFTKGIEEKLLIVERMLEMFPELRGRFTFVQLAEPSRRRLATYRRARLRLLETAERINRRFSSAGYSPIVIVEAHHSMTSMARHFRGADVCFVNSLHDGMNLVSKEFVASRDDEQGVLVLSEFAGAAGELYDALLVNPYDVDGAATVLAAALTMPADEQRERMKRLRAAVARNTASTWAARMLTDTAGELEQPAAEEALLSAAS